MTEKRGAHNLYASLTITSVIKSRRMRWVSQIARMGDEKYAHNFGQKS
jgi:hypothetical protein